MLLFSLFSFVFPRSSYLSFYLLFPSLFCFSHASLLFLFLLLLLCCLFLLPSASLLSCSSPPHLISSSSSFSFLVDLFTMLCRWLIVSAEKNLSQRDAWQKVRLIYYALLIQSILLLTSAEDTSQTYFPRKEKREREKTFANFTVEVHLLRQQSVPT